MLEKDEQLPPVLYKYFSRLEYLRGALDAGELFFANPLSFNDPNELRHGVVYGETADDYVRHFIGVGLGMGQTQTDAELNARIVAAALRNQVEPPDVIRQQTGKRLGIFCLAERCDNDLMWSHYGASHTGVCVGFTTALDFFRLAMPVHYSDEFPVVDRNRDPNNEQLRKTLLRKSTRWAYEQEWRVIKHKHDYDAVWRLSVQRGTGEIPTDEDYRLLVEQFGGDRLYRFNRKAIVEVVFGLKTPRDWREKTYAWLKGLPVRFHATTRQPGSYGLAVEADQGGLAGRYGVR